MIIFHNCAIVKFNFTRWEFDGDKDDRNTRLSIFKSSYKSSFKSGLFRPEKRNRINNDQSV